MGRYTRSKPERLAEKLLEIRTKLGLSQNEIIRHLGLDDVISQSRVSGYELGTREPALTTLLAYARAAGVSVDVLIDDKANLPKKLPEVSVHGLRKNRARKSASQKKG
jgi:transcriptional regulator with XRE-family HTH domain